MSKFIVHIAGPVENQRQACSRCGLILIDYRDKIVMIPIGDDTRLCFWPDHGFIGSAGAGQVLMHRDAWEADEVLCGEP